AADQRGEEHRRRDDQRDAAHREDRGPAPDGEVADVVGERDGHQKRRRSASTTFRRAPFQAGTMPATRPTVAAIATPSSATAGDIVKLASGPRKGMLPVFPAARSAPRITHAPPAPASPPTSAISVDSAISARRIGRRRKPRLFSTAISGMRSRTPIALVLAAMRTTAPTTRKPTIRITRMKPLKELKKLAKNVFSVSAATSASEFRKRASTRCLIASTCSGLSARSQIMPTSPKRPRPSIASSRYFRLNQRIWALPNRG